jgi:hypothetical protein
MLSSVRGMLLPATIQRMRADVGGEIRRRGDRIIYLLQYRPLKLRSSSVECQKKGPRFFDFHCFNRYNAPARCATKRPRLAALKTRIMRFITQRIVNIERIEYAAYNHFPRTNGTASRV